MRAGPIRNPASPTGGELDRCSEPICLNPLRLCVSFLFRSGFGSKENSTMPKNWLICRLTKIAKPFPRLSIVQN